MPTDVDYVRIMTPYKSKGLIADMVVVTTCVESLQPVFEVGVSSEEKRSLEEQWGVFFVAITRTRQTLALSSVTTVPLNDAYRMRLKFKKKSGGNAFSVATRFIGPICPSAVTGTAFLAAEGGTNK